MKCVDCPYYYKAEDDKIALCHCTEPEGLAPCEIDNEEGTEEEDDEE